MSNSNVKPKMLELLEDKLSSALQNTCVRKHFLNKTPFGQELRQTTDEWNLINYLQQSEKKE